MSERRLHTLAERPDRIDRLTGLVHSSWAEFMLHSNVAKELWRELRARFFDLQWVLHDEEADEVVGLGNTTPLFWDGDVEHLPGGFDAVLQASVRDHAEGVRPNTLSALQATVAPNRRGQGRCARWPAPTASSTSSRPCDRHGRSGTRWCPSTGT